MIPASQNGPMEMQSKDKEILHTSSDAGNTLWHFVVYV